MVIFEVFLHVRQPMVATFNEVCEVISPKDIVKQGMTFSKPREKH